MLAILLDQRIRGEDVLRTIYLYPLAVSFVVTGTVWSWLLNPGLGIQKFVRSLGWDDFRFDWITDRDMAIYTIVIAARLAGLGLRHGAVPRRAALGRPRSHQGGADRRRRPGAHLPARRAARASAPIFIAVLVILLQFAIKTFDLVRALTGGGPASPPRCRRSWSTTSCSSAARSGAAAAAAVHAAAVAARRAAALLRLWRAGARAGESGHG